MNQFRLDLHTHSIISYDGGINSAEYVRILANKNHFIAITDHNEISFAKDLNQRVGEQVIVGEEIMTTEGEIIGLFLKEKINPGLSAMETCRQIKLQQGLVYIPHPLETLRKGLNMETLNSIKSEIDIIETFNARLRQPHLLPIVENFAANFLKASSSDAHGIRGFGSSYSLVADKPNRSNILELLRSATLVKSRASFLAYLDPAKNKLKKKLHL